MWSAWQDMPRSRPSVLRLFNPLTGNKPCFCFCFCLAGLWATISRLTDSLTYSALDFGYWLWYLVSSGLHRTTWVTDGPLLWTGEPGGIAVKTCAGHLDCESRFFEVGDQLLFSCGCMSRCRAHDFQQQPGLRGRGCRGRDRRF